jgi:hypothetical protein
LVERPFRTGLSLEHDGLRGVQGLMIKKFMGDGWKRMFKDRIPMVLEYAKERGWTSFPKDRSLLPSDCHQQPL